MAAQINPDGAHLRNLPIELIREIGSQLITPTELLDFKCICKQTEAAIGLLDMAKKDAIWQISKIRFRSRFSSLYMTEDKELDSLGLDILAYCRSYRQVHLHRPILLWAIETGKDIDYIKKCINVYQTYFPVGLRGKWFPHHDRILEAYIYPEFPSPMVAAARAGRLDVIKALVECGSSPRGRDRAICMDLRRHPLTLQEERSLETISADNAISAACEFGHEDIAMFLMSIGLRLEPSDIWNAVQFGCFKLLEILLDQYTAIDRNDVLGRFFSSVITGPVRPIRTHQIIVPLICALDTSSPNGTREYIKEHTKEKLVFALRHQPTDKARLRATDFFDFYIKWASPLFSALRTINGAASNDANVEITNDILDGDSWSIGGSEEEQLGTMNRIARIVVENGHTHIAKSLFNSGYRFNSEHIQYAIHYTELEMVELLIAYGVPMPTRIQRLMDRDMYAGVLEGAYEAGMMRCRRASTYLLMFRLIHHGADYTDNFCWIEKERLLNDLKKDGVFRRWYNSEESNAAKTATPSRLSFAERVEIWYSAEYLNQLYALSTLILGNDWMERRAGQGSED
ncbi:hypothetical protein M434DRAFT_9598 [Hypoxylon sp. CO27-5]|nr:hypothetical protein M434DRAFT_9598 [Hypoxylon sp. CO27-5]